MISIPVKHLDFNIPSHFTVRNGSEEISFSLTQLIHAAITVGHERGWRKHVGSSIGGQMELIWKLAAFMTSVEERHYRTYSGDKVRLEKTSRMAIPLRGAPLAITLG